MLYHIWDFALLPYIWIIAQLFRGHSCHEAVRKVALQDQSQQNNAEKGKPNKLSCISVAERIPIEHGLGPRAKGTGLKGNRSNCKGVVGH
jgi:hypothetical protein